MNRSGRLSILAGLLFAFIFYGWYLGWININGKTGLSVNTTPHPSAKLLSFSSIIEQASPAVVSLFISKSQPKKIKFPDSNEILTYKSQSNADGSGVILDAKLGIIITNYHVIANAVTITAELANGQLIPSKVLGFDKVNDLAVLQLLDASSYTIDQVLIGQSDSLLVGDILLAVGNPFGTGQAVTQGILSARTTATNNPYIDVLHTDALVLPGNSGGALLDIEGKLVGITSAFLSDGSGVSGLGVAIPIESVKRIVQSILKFGEVIRGWVGSFAVRELNTRTIQKLSARRYSRGLLVTNIQQAPASSEKYLREGDIIIGIDKEPGSLANLRKRLTTLLPGDQIEISYVRLGEDQTSLNLESLVLTAQHPPTLSN